MPSICNFLWAINLHNYTWWLQRHYIQNIFCFKYNKITQFQYNVFFPYIDYSPICSTLLNKVFLRHQSQLKQHIFDKFDIWKVFTMQWIFFYFIIFILYFLSNRFHLDSWQTQICIAIFTTDMNQAFWEKISEFRFLRKLFRKRRILEKINEVHSGNQRFLIIMGNLYITMQVSYKIWTIWAVLIFLTKINPRWFSASVVLQ